MRPLIDVHFTIWLDEDCTCAMVPPGHMPVPGCAEVPSNAKEVINTLCHAVIDDLLWDEWFGLDVRKELVYVTVTAPAWLQGGYEVILGQEITAASRKLTMIAKG
jgi:hypothetical protein